MKGQDLSSLAQQTSININEQPWAECECKGKTFRNEIMFKRISSILSPSGKEEVVPIEVFVCNKCNKIPGFISKMLPDIPELMKASVSISD